MEQVIQRNESELFKHVPLAATLEELDCVTTDQGRYYTSPDGNIYPSITTVLGILNREPLREWRTRIGEQKAKAISEHAAGRGTDLHSAIEAYLKNEPPIFPVDPKSRVRIMFNRMKRMLENIDNIKAQEVALYSDVLKVAGRCDCIAEYKGELSIVDFKSTTKAKVKEWIGSYFMQTAGYALMFEERTGIKIEQLVILMSGEDDFSCQVFVEQRDRHIGKLKDTIAQFEREAERGKVESLVR